MIRVYYHIFCIDGVESIIDEQLNLIENCFSFPYVINFGLNIGQENRINSEVFDKIQKNKRPNYLIRDVRMGGNEFTTLDLIYKDKDMFGKDDYILYLHTKGVSRLNQSQTMINRMIEWRHFMNYYCIEKVKDAFKIFEKTDFNTYGVNLRKPKVIETDTIAYFGNFWWARGEYLKTLDKNKYDTTSRAHAEMKFLQSGQNWKPYCVKESGINHYYTDYKKQNYR